MTLSSARARFTRLLADARRPLAITGAGVSAESGIPTFRGPAGLWRSHRPEDLATPEAFARNPQRVWEWYAWRRGLCAAARPNPAHRWLARYERDAASLLLVTQNIDGLHRLAGSRRLVEIHGSIWHLRCTRCDWREENRDRQLPLPPRCPRCGALARPGVVWFGEALPEEGLVRATRAARDADLLLVFGTSAVVYPVAGLPDLARGAPLVEVNPQATPLTPRAELSVRSPVGEFLAPLLDGETATGPARGPAQQTTEEAT